MKTVIKFEEAGLTAISIYFLIQHNPGVSAWIWALLFFSPDISMLGYLANPRFGAFTYNLFHHRGVAVLVAGLGLWLNNEILTSIGSLLFAHSSFDRMLGYGLKYSDSFGNTHLGKVGKL